MLHLFEWNKFLEFKGQHSLTNTRRLLNIGALRAIHSRRSRLDDDCLCSRWHFEDWQHSEATGGVLNFMATLALMLGDHTLNDQC